MASSDSFLADTGQTELDSTSESLYSPLGEYAKATVATVANAVDSNAKEESQEGEDGSIPKKMRTEEPEAAPAEAAAAAASTRGPLRREAMKSRIIVQKTNGSEKYSLVLSAAEVAAKINCVIAARERAIIDEGRECFGASPEDARRVLLLNHRACFVTAGDNLTYLVFDFKMQQRSRSYAFKDWASTPEAYDFLWKKGRNGWWKEISSESLAGRFVIPHGAKGVFKTYCDHTFGGQIWFNVLNQMGGCPAEFVESWNAVINQRLQAAF